MRLYKVLAVLLEYPSGELFGALAEIQELVGSLEGASDSDRQALRDFLGWAGSIPLMDWQSHYVATFDLNPDNALYLTHHLFEEQDRGRGPALVKLSEYFRAQGYAIDNGELPDYLPLLLEYVSTLPPGESSRQFLGQAVHVATILARSLEKLESPYAPLLRIVERHGTVSEMAA